MQIGRFLRAVIILALIVSAFTACNTDKNGTPGQTISTPDSIGTAAPSVEPTPGKTVPPATDVSPVPVTQPLNKLHSSSEYFSPALGLCEDYPRGTRVETIERDFALMAEYGISDMRVSIAWGDYEPIKGSFDWELLDAEVALAEKYGIKLYPYICYSPSWATGGQWSDPPKDLERWYDFVYAVADRYKGRINNWEIWNEGDNYDFWHGSWQQQLELVRTGARAVKDANPDAKTVFGGLTDTRPSHIDTIYSSGVSDYIDVINIHFYNETWNPAPTEEIYGTIKSVADVIRKHGGKQELWVAEIGYSDYVQKNGKVSDWVKMNAPYEKTREFQAVTFTRAYSLIAATEDISNLLWYEIKNLRLDSAAIGDVNNYFLGALDHNYFPKHLWFAIASFKELFSSPYKCMDSEIYINKINAVKPYVHAFRRENGDVILIAWNRGTNDESIEVTVPGTFRGALKYSTTGEKTPYEYKADGNNTLLRLDLKPENVNIIELFSERKPPRLTIKDPQIIKSSDGSYKVSATAVNLGDEDARGISGRIYLNEALELISDTEIRIDSLSAGKEFRLTWIVKVINTEKQPQLWIALNHPESPGSALLLELDNGLAP